MIRPQDVDRFSFLVSQRSALLALPCLLALLGVLAPLGLLGCGGGGGGGGGTRNSTGPDAKPTLIAATIVMNGTVPAAGDLLLLLMSEDAELTGSSITNADLTISQGSLGQITQTPTMRNARTIQITLGAGVTLTPGTTTIDFAEGSGGITDSSGNKPVPGSPRLLAAGDGDDPTATGLTLSGVDSTANGDGTSGGTLQVPTHGFTIDVSHHDTTSSINGADLIVVCSTAVTIDGIARQAGTDLGDALTVSASTATGTSLLVGANASFPTGANTLTVLVRDATGMISQPRSFSFSAVSPTDAIRPFETSVNPSQVWYLHLGRDLESYSVNTLNFVTPIEVTATPNGRSDIEDLLLVLGLTSMTPIANVNAGLDSNQVVMLQLRTQLLADLSALHPGVNVNFTFTQPGSFPGSSTVPYSSLGFSQICIAGADSATGNQGTLGVAMFDPGNKDQNNNCLVSFQGSRLGVFLHTIVNDGFRSHPTTVFRTTYDDFTAARFGTPIGEAADDDKRLLGTLVDGRTDAIRLAIQRLSRFAAVITAHECGHSVGLVANGAMPAGLYGDDAEHFPVYPTSAADGHIKMPSSLFPGNAENIMSPAFDFESGIDPGTRFNTLNLAYLRERVLPNH